MISLIIASDNRLYREALVSQLAGKENIKTVVATENAELTIKKTYELDPDVVLVDMTMQDSCQIVSNVTPSRLKTKVIVLSMTEDENNILHCAQKGVAGYLTRNATFDHLLSAISSVVDGELFCPRKIAESLFVKINSIHNLNNDYNTPSNDEISAAKILLTQREKEIASLLKGGKSNKEIARELTIEVSTVKNHVHNILTKMGVQNRMQAVNRLQQHFSSD